MKTLGGNGKPVKDKIFTLREGLSYALTPAIVSGVSTVAAFKKNAALVTSFSAMTADELVALGKRCEAATQSNTYQPYCKWMSYRDGDALMGR